MRDSILESKPQKTEYANQLPNNKPYTLVFKSV